MAKEGVAVCFCITVVANVEIMSVPKGWKVARIVPQCFVLELILFVLCFLSHGENKSCRISQVLIDLIIGPWDFSVASKSFALITQYKSYCAM